MARFQLGAAALLKTSNSLPLIGNEQQVFKPSLSFSSFDCIPSTLLQSRFADRSIIELTLQRLLFDRQPRKTCGVRPLLINLYSQYAVWTSRADIEVGLQLSAMRRCARRFRDVFADQLCKPVTSMYNRSRACMYIPPYHRFVHSMAGDAG